MMSDGEMNFILGPTKAGKTTFCQFLNGFHLTISRASRSFNIQSTIPLGEECKIGNNAISETKMPHYYDAFCDFPGFADTRGEENNLTTLVELYSELQKFKKIRLILLVEEIHICSANGSLLINILTDFIKLFELTREEAERIIVVVTKTDESFCESIPDIFEEMFSGDFNFIIEGIKRRQIKVLPFEKPMSIGTTYQMNETNKVRFIEQLNNTTLLDCSNFMDRIYKKIETKLVSIRQEYERYSNIIFTSKKRISTKLESDYILCIDEDIQLDQENLELNAPTIIVLPKENRNLYLEIIGESPRVVFNERIRRVIKGDKLVVSTKGKSDMIEFPDPTSKNFSSNWQFFRLESICVNGGWTEYASHNNKFIDLIVYLNPNFGTVVVNPDFKIKTINIDIRLKLHINECMRTKKNIMENFLSIRMCKDIDEYLEKSRKTYIKDEIKEALQEYVIKLPSIFQLFIKSADLQFFFQKPSETKDLVEIKGILIENYLRLLSDFTNTKTQLDYTDDLIQAYKTFTNFCRRNLKPGYGEISASNSKLLKGLKLLLNANLPDSAVLDFLSFFDTLSISEKKTELCRYQVTGDISSYANFQSLINKKFGVGMELAEFRANYLNLGNGLLIGGGLTLGFGAGRLLVVRSAASIPVRAGIGASTAIAAFLGAALIVGDVAVNLICTLAKSGYYNGEFIPDPKYYRLDI